MSSQFPLLLVQSSEEKSGLNSAGSHLRLGTEGQDSFRVRSGILVVVIVGV
jgi:hypothetical protein